MIAFARQIVSFIADLASGKPGNLRSPHWPTVRAKWLAENPKCASCGGTENLEVHHCKPYHLHPQLELDSTNFITLCEKPGHVCHFVKGHLLNWKSWNVNVRADAAEYLRKVMKRPTAGGDSEDQTKVA